jgi:hypothetical protein
MKMQFSLAAGLTGLLGVAWLFFPRYMLVSWGVQPDRLPRLFLPHAPT